MNKTLNVLVDRLHAYRRKATGILSWGCPVPAFGDVTNSVIATLGLNPSNREFVDHAGRELAGPQRRLHTLKSLRLARWSDATAEHIEMIQRCCRNYFSANPYNGWFRTLEQIIGGAKCSYYGSTANACHLDLIPYATRCKWTELTSAQRSGLLALAGDALGQVVRHSSLRLLLFNGRTVADNLKRIGDAHFECIEMVDWTLPRRVGAGVVGYGFRGTLTRLSGVDLGRKIGVLGYNHNIQSSFGVSAKVKAGIRRWVSDVASEVLSWDL